MMQDTPLARKLRAAKPQVRRARRYCASECSFHPAWGSAKPDRTHSRTSSRLMCAVGTPRWSAQCRAMVVLPAPAAPISSTAIGPCAAPGSEPLPCGSGIWTGVARGQREVPGGAGSGAGRRAGCGSGAHGPRLLRRRAARLRRPHGVLHVGPLHPVPEVQLLDRAVTVRSTPNGTAPGRPCVNALPARCPPAAVRIPGPRRKRACPGPCADRVGTEPRPPYARRHPTFRRTVPRTGGKPIRRGPGAGTGPSCGPGRRWTPAGGGRAVPAPLGSRHPRAGPGPGPRVEPRGRQRPTRPRFLRERAQREPVGAEAEPGDRAGGDRGDHRGVPELLAGVRVGDVHLDQRRGALRRGVPQRVRVVREGARG